MEMALTIFPFSWPFLLACCERRMQRLDRKVPNQLFFQDSTRLMNRLR